MKWIDPDASPAWFDWLGILGFALTIVALLMAWAELRNSRKTTEAVNKKLTEARLRLNGDQLAAVVPQVNTIVADLDFAIDSNDREVAHRSLLRFSYVAIESIALLDNLTADHADVQERLRNAGSKALDVKGVIVSSKSPDIARLAKAISVEISSIAVALSGVVATARYTLGEEGDV